MTSSTPHEPLEGEAARAAVDAVRTGCVDAGEPDPLDEAADLRWRHHGTDGFAHVIHAGGFALRHEHDLTLAVHPDRRGAGLGGELLTTADAPTGATAWSHGDAPAARRLAERQSWRRARELWVMRRPSTAALPRLDETDLSVRGYRPTDADDVLRLNAAAFAHHPEQGGLDRAGLDERMAEPWFDADGLLLAVDADGEVLGFHWTKRHSPELGEVYVVAVGPQAQGRGVGRLVTLAGLHHLVDGGADEVLLYVEADNLPARRLYDSLGFEHRAADTHVQYAHE